VNQELPEEMLTMSKVPATAEEIDDIGHLDLVEISEPWPNALRLVVEELTTGDLGPGEEPPVPGALPLKHANPDRTFELVWERYVAYNVFNESFSDADNFEEFKGLRLRTYSISRYLNFIQQMNIALDGLMPGYKHWQIVCTNHIIDVVANENPTIERAL
jgi:hypothetical protein